MNWRGLIAFGVIVFSGQRLGYTGETISFEEVPSPPEGYLYGYPVGNGYRGFIWDNWWALSGSLYLSAFLPGPYPASPVSGDWFITNGGGASAGIRRSVPFNLISMYSMAGWNDGLQVEAKGLLNGTVLYDRFFTVDTAGPAFVQLDFLNVDDVTFEAGGGVPDPKYLRAGDGPSFTIDDLRVGEISDPLPDGGSTLSLSLMAAGLFFLVRIGNCSGSRTSINYGSL